MCLAFVNPGADRTLAGQSLHYPGWSLGLGNQLPVQLVSKLQVQWETLSPKQDADWPLAYTHTYAHAHVLTHIHMQGEREMKEEGGCNGICLLSPVTQESSELCESWTLLWHPHTYVHWYTKMLNTHSGAHLQSQPLGQPGLHREFQHSQGYIDRPCLKTTMKYV